MKLRATGCIPDPPEVIAYLRAHPLPRVQFIPEELPDSVDLSVYLPPTGNQGSLGSCVCWAVCYNQKSYDEYDEFGWDLNDTKHQFSPSYIFNQIKIPYNGGWGAYPTHAYKELCNQGCCSLFHFPYTLDVHLMSTADQQEYAKPYKINSYSAFSRWELHKWRELLADGRMFTITIPVSDEFDNPPANNIIDNAIDGKRGLHMVCACGYSFDIDNTGISGFKIKNSWGSNYGDNGCVWLTDNFITDGGCIAYYMQDLVTPPTNLHTKNYMLLWDGPIENIYNVYEKANNEFEIIDTITANGYGTVQIGTYGIGAYGSEMIETVIVEECIIPNCYFGVIS